MSTFGDFMIGQAVESNQEIDHLRELNRELLEALRKAEAFIEDELNVRKQSFLPEGSPYIDEAQNVLDLVGAAISKAVTR
jgi:hypothetical protein